MCGECCEKGTNPKILAWNNSKVVRYRSVVNMCENRDWFDENSKIFSG